MNSAKSFLIKSAHALMHFLGLDRAIAFTAFGRVFQSIASVITVILISKLMSPVEQGYYYAIWSLWALQTVFELGFSFVILQVAAHERANLNLAEDGTLHGDFRSIKRLAGLLKTVQRWYLLSALAMVITLLILGFHFFNAKPSAGVEWQAPWIFTVIAAGLMFQIDPTVSFLEGCGYVTEVATQRLVQTVAGSLVAWMVMLSRHGLYAPGFIITIQALTGLIFFYRHRRLLLQLLREDPGGQSISWRREILPFQWRVALSWLCSYIPSTLFTPLLFAVRGPVEAGRMGLSMNIALSLGVIALSWMTTKAAPFGSFVARGEIAELDDLFFRTLRQSTMLVGAGAVTIFFGIGLVGRYLPSIGHRMLPQSIFAFLLLTTICNHVVQSEALYLRSHKREPFLFLSMGIAVLLIASSWLLANWAGTFGLAVAYFLCSGIIASIAGTLIFVIQRKAWSLRSEMQP